jgi:hypothetical protein
MLVEVVGVPGLVRVSVVDDAHFRTTNSAAVPLDWIKATFDPSREMVGEVVTA